VITGRVPSVRERYLVAELEFGINLAAASRRESNQEALIGFLAMVVVFEPLGCFRFHWPADLTDHHDAKGCRIFGE